MNSREEAIYYLHELFYDIDDTEGYFPILIKLFITGLLFLTVGVIVTIFSPVFAITRNRKKEINDTKPTK